MHVQLASSLVLLRTRVMTFKDSKELSSLLQSVAANGGVKVDDKKINNGKNDIYR